MFTKRTSQFQQPVLQFIADPSKKEIKVNSLDASGPSNSIGIVLEATYVRWSWPSLLKI